MTENVADYNARSKAFLASLPETRKVPRIITEPAIPQGWTDHGGGLWGWLSPEGAVSVSIHVFADGSVSPPAVFGSGSFRIAARGLRQALAAQEALLDYVARRAEWEAVR